MRKEEEYKGNSSVEFMGEIISFPYPAFARIFLNDSPGPGVKDCSCLQTPVNEDVYFIVSESCCTVKLLMIPVRR